MNILLTFNSGYVFQATTMLKSLLHANPTERFDVYVMNTALKASELDWIAGTLNSSRLTLHDVKIDIAALSDAPITKRYPREMYFRIFAAHFLPKELDRILYLDPDLVVLNDLSRLYRMDLGNAFFAAASHVRRFLTKINEIRLGMSQPGPYINSGVMLLNLRRLRDDQRLDKVYTYIKAHKSMLILPDQDVISALYGQKIILLDPFIYNMTERQLSFNASRYPWLTLSWIRKNTVIVHYCGRNKPWNARYFGKLDVFYQHALRL